LLFLTYTNRLSQSEFIVPYWKFTKSFGQPFSVGLRFKMRYESEDSAERRFVCSTCFINSHYLELNTILLMHMRLSYRYTGIITGTGDADPMWRGSKWKCLLVCLTLVFVTVDYSQYMLCLQYTFFLVL
jgi:auxin response factor